MSQTGRGNKMEGTAHGTRRGYPFNADIAYGDMTKTWNYSIHPGAGVSTYQASDEISQTVRSDTRSLNAACEDERHRGKGYHRPNWSSERNRPGYQHNR